MQLGDKRNIIIHNTLQSFTDPNQEQKSHIPEQKACKVQYNGPSPLENQIISPTQMFYNEQSSSDDAKDAVKDMR